MAQRHRKNYLIQSFGISAPLRERMLSALASQQTHTRDTPLNVSSWICRAIERDLAHRERSRRVRLTPAPPVVEQYEDSAFAFASTEGILPVSG